MSLSNLKQSRGSSIDKLVAASAKLNESSANNNGPDERKWKPSVDKAGNGYAVIRFLPAPEGEELPWVRVWNHAFQGPTGQWFIENSLTTLGQKDPLAEYNSTLWNSGIEANKEIARKQKRRLTYFSNIYVVEDKANPQNEGKVFLFRYGKKIFDKVSSMANPEFEDESPVDVFNFWDGANFKLKIRKVDGFWNYDKSEFDAPTPLHEDETAMETAYNAEHGLKQFHESSNFKTYEELKEKMERVLGESRDNRTAEQIAQDVEDSFGEPDSSKPPFEGGTSTKSTPSDTMDYFEKLATS